MEIQKNKNDESFFAKEKDLISKIEESGEKKVLKWYDFGASSLRREIKTHPAQYFFLFVTSFIGSIITSALFLYGITHNIEAKFSIPTFGLPNISKVAPLNPVASFQTPEINGFDPYLLLTMLQKNSQNYTLVDIRTVGEYKSGHIKTAVNIPIYGTNIIDEKENLNVEAVKKAFDNIMKNDKEIIIYAQTAYSTVPLDVASILDKSGQKVKVLSIGWNEWAYFKALWVPEKEWNTINPANFIEKKG